MDSLPTGSTQSWLIVAAVAFSPVIVLFLADAIGWLIRQPALLKAGPPLTKPPAGADRPVGHPVGSAVGGDPCVLYPRVALSPGDGHANPRFALRLIPRNRSSSNPVPKLRARRVEPDGIAPAGGGVEPAT